MTLEFPLWAIPTAVTVAIWAITCFLPLPAQRGDYDFFSPMVVLAQLAGALSLTLLVWLVFFIVV